MRPSIAALRATLVVAALTSVGWLMARAPLKPFTAGLAALLAVMLLLHQPWLGLCGLALTVPFAPLASASLGPLRVGLAEALVLAMLLAWFMRGTMGDARRIQANGLTLAVGAVVLTTLIAVYPAQELVPAAKDFAKWAGLGAVFLFASSQLTETQARWIVAALLVGGAAQGLLGIYQFATQSGPEGFQILGRYMRAHGTFGQPNPYAGYLGLLLPLSYAVPVSLVVRKDTQRASAWLLAGLVTVCGLAMAAGLVLSWSRGALLGALASATMVLLASGQRARVGALIVGLVALGLWPWIVELTPQGVMERLWGGLQLLGTDLSATEVTDANFAVIERMAHWLAAWRMFAQHPWTGVGLGQYTTIYPEVAIPRWADPLGHAHNMYLHVLAEQGLLGAAGLVAFMVGSMAAAWRRIRRGSGWRRGVALGCWGMLWHLAVHSVVDLLFVQGLYLLIGMILGLMVAVCAEDETDIGTDCHAVT